MEKATVQKLKKLTKDVSLLYIQSNKALQKQMGGFLGMIFENLYFANDGKEGFEKFDKFRPDIVLTDLSLSKKSAFELIVDIKEIEPKQNIITLSPKDNDDLELLRSIDFGIKHFLYKPIDMEKLNKALIDLLSQDKNGIDLQAIKDLKNISKKAQSIRILNYYKGIPMIHEGKIKEIKDDEVLLNVPLVQSLAMRYEKHTVIELPDKRHIGAYVLKYDKKTSVITIIKPKYINYLSRDLKNKRLVPDKSFHGVLHYHNKKCDLKVLEISNNSVFGYIEDNDFSIDEKDEVEVGLVFDLENKNAFINGSLTTKSFGHGKVKRKEITNGGFKLLIELEIKKSDESTFNKYLSQREMNIITEFKQLVKRNQ